MKKRIFILNLAIMFLSLAVPAEAQRRGRGGNQQNQRAQQERKKREAEQKAREKKREAFEDFMKPKDKNHDGSLTREEFMNGGGGAEAAGKKFDQYNLNNDRYLTKPEIEAMLDL
jgi:hemolysin activation/secretion protein